MPLPDNLLNPIPGASPGGENLRYAPVYDKIKEARREEEDLPQGDWEHEVKVSDPILVTKLAVEALTNKSKDVQIAAWLAEACLRREGYAGLKEGLDLIRGLLENFWDTLHPEIEDGDLELRAAPLDWIGNYFPNLVYRRPLTQEGYDWRILKECRAVPTEAEAAENENKATIRSEKLSEGKLAPETFEEDVQRTPKQFYKDMVEGIEAALESLQSLSELADSKFGNQAPSFGKLRTALEELHHLGRGFLKKKLEVEPDEDSGETTETTEEAGAEEATGEPAEDGAPARPGRGKKALTAEPADKDDAVNRVMVAAKYWRSQEPLNPAPYLMVRGMRWGELRASGSEPDQLLFEPPPTELRQQMKKLSLEGNWAEVLEAAETAAAMPCGRAWLDLHRYSVKACENLGSEYLPIMVGILSGLRSLLADFPQLSGMTLMDDTPVANAETVAWIKDSVGTAAPAANAALPEALQVDSDARPAPAGEAAPPDPYEVAGQMVKEGRAEAAIEMLANEVAKERFGRTRFQRMIQLASLCMATSHERIAYPILMELADEIDRRKLEDWESRSIIAQPLALLYRCLVRMDSGDEELKKKVYERVCRLDPVQALSCVK